MVGKDWAQIGVAQLFSKIEENGYKILYLSARAIGQSRATRDYLKSIQQGDVKLPGGPIFLNPTSLISAFHREVSILEFVYSINKTFFQVIERKPEQFKIECLSDVKRLFGEKNPFYAGYGNRINVRFYLNNIAPRYLKNLNINLGCLGISCSRNTYHENLHYQSKGRA